MTDPWTPDALRLLAALRGGVPCSECEGVGEFFHGNVSRPARCPRCKGCGKASPDSAAAGPLADALAEALGGGPGVLPGLLCAYAGLTEPCPRCSWRNARSVTRAACPDCRGSGRVPGPPEDRIVLAAYHDANGGPGRAAAVRGLGVVQRYAGDPRRGWYVFNGITSADGVVYPTEPAARRALKGAVLALHDGDTVPCGACAAFERRRRRRRGRAPWTTCGVCHGQGRVPLRVPCPGCGGEGGRAYPNLRAGGPPGWAECDICGGAGDVRPSGLAAAPPPAGPSDADFEHLARSAAQATETLRQLARAARRRDDA